MDNPQNILLLVWDACRSDAVKSAPTFQELSEDNLSFSEVYTPATWSHPSHASLFTGDRPSEHGICTTEDSYTGLPLVESLQSEGYYSSCVTANTYASHSFNFDAIFDSYVFTHTFDNPDGVRVDEELISYSDQNPEASRPRRLLHLLNLAFSHENMAESLENVLRLLTRKSLGSIKSIPYWNSNDTYGYRPEWNTPYVRREIREHASNRKDDSPFFLFSNYMTPHHPYLPELEHQRALENDRIYSQKELKEVNKSTGHPLAFIEKEQNDEGDLELLRDAYNSDVHAVDAELKKVVSTLERHGILDETLIIVTSDHGELLGEEDYWGNRRIGHLDSVSDHLWTVPLLFIHPNLSGMKIEEPVEFQRLIDVITKVGADKSISAKWIVDELVTTEPIIIERPPRINTERTDEFDIPQNVIERLKDCLAFVRYKDWTVVHGESTGTQIWSSEDEVSISSAPSDLVELAKEASRNLRNEIDKDNETTREERLSKEVVDRLEQLGYR